jgi:DNA-nicking Smr family endonuclease
MGDNPDYAGPEGNRLRAEAQRYAAERSEFLSASTKAFEAGEKGKAKELSDQGKEAGRKMEEANRQAAETILIYRNSGHGENYLDLHGLYLEEALSAFRDRLNKLQSSMDQDIVFEVIPGAGHHSKNKAVIKPKIIDELKKLNLPFEEKNAGTLLVTLSASSSTKAKPTKYPETSRLAVPTSEEDISSNKSNLCACCIVM